jgi:hypothetical protein
MPTSLGPCGACWVIMAERRKLEAAMLVLTVLGTLLIVPPLVYIFSQPISHFGVPQVVIYLFAWWALIIAATALLTHWMPRDSADPGERD